MGMPRFPAVTCFEAVPEEAEPKLEDAEGAVEPFPAIFPLIALAPAPWGAPLSAAVGEYPVAEDEVPGELAAPRTSERFWLIEISCSRLLICTNWSM